MELASSLKSPQSGPLLQLIGVGHSWTANSGEPQVLFTDVCLSLQPGEQVCICGPQGCGKTSLARLVSGMLPPSHGELWLQGVELTSLSSGKRDQLRREQCVFLIQNEALLPGFSVSELLQLAAACARRSVSAEAIAALLERLGLAACATALAEDLTQVQQQSVLIARAVLLRPTYIVADDFAGSLPVAQAAACLDRLSAVAAEDGIALLLFTAEPQVLVQLQIQVQVPLAQRIRTLQFNDLRGDCHNPAAQAQTGAEA